MANCNKLFLDFDKELNVLPAKKTKLTKSKDDLRDRIRNHFKKEHEEYNPTFYIQGSKKMGTLIRTKDDECDLDDGVYFIREEDVTGTTLQKWIKEAVDDATNTPTQHRNKCVRVIYKGDYHIDIPVYYFPEDTDHPLLAVKDNNLEESDPKEFVDWFRENKDENGQLVRIIKYLKSWCDYKRNKMPSGLAMTVLAECNIKYNERDDISIRDTLKEVKATIDDRETFIEKFKCFMPTTPKDDLFEDYDDTRKNNFLENLDDFIEDADKAIEEKNQLKASKLWQKHLGDRFPLGEDEDIDAKENALRKTASSILAGKAFTSRYGNIHETDDGVKHKKHSNYGG
ncbi:MAG: hypothetical protein K8R68_04160 [Bacteroidales bacterium]|nr:hypothetical protein [Bacteroidales bacterium]